MKRCFIEIVNINDLTNHEIDSIRLAIKNNTFKAIEICCKCVAIEIRPIGSIVIEIEHSKAMKSCVMKIVNINDLANHEIDSIRLANDIYAFRAI